MGEPDGRALGQLLRERVEQAYPGTGGQSRFRDVLASRFGVTVSRQTVSHWLTGERMPEPGKLLAILDALDVHGAERERAQRFAWGYERPTQNRDEPEQALS